MIENSNGGHDPIPMSQITGLTADLNQLTRPAPGPRKRRRTWLRRIVIWALLIITMVLGARYVSHVPNDLYWGVQGWGLSALLAGFLIGLTP